MESGKSGESETCLWCGKHVPCMNAVCNTKDQLHKDRKSYMVRCGVPPLYHQCPDLEPKQVEFVNKAVHDHHGGVFLVGPAGTGKTTVATKIFVGRMMQVATDTGVDAMTVGMFDILDTPCSPLDTSMYDGSRDATKP